MDTGEDLGEGEQQSLPVSNASQEKETMGMGNEAGEEGHPSTSHDSDIGLCIPIIQPDSVALAECLAHPDPIAHSGTPETMEVKFREDLTASDVAIVDTEVSLDKSLDDGIDGDFQPRETFGGRVKFELNPDEDSGRDVDDESPLVHTGGNEVRNPDGSNDSEDAEDQAVKEILLLKAINSKYLPAFANEENVILHDSILETELALKKAEEAVEEQDDRAAIMEEHMKRVQQEIYFSQSRHEAKRREIATEQHLLKMSDLESVRLKGEMKKMTKEKENIDSKLHALRTSLFRGNEKMDQFRLLMHWNQSRRNWSSGHRLHDRRMKIILQWTNI